MIPPLLWLSDQTRLPEERQAPCPSGARTCQGPLRGRGGGCPPDNAAMGRTIRAGVLRGDNIGRGLIATALVLTAGFAPSFDQVQPATAAPPAQQPAVGFDPAPPAAAAALDMYTAVETWVRRWQTPMDPMGMTPVHAAAVTLRYEGSIVGRGVSVTAEPAGGIGMLIMAASRAMSEAKERMPIPHDALFEDNLKAAAARIAITVEIAGRPIPISPKEYADAINEVAPGLDGAAVRMGDRIEAMFPETMLVTGTDAAGALAALASKVSGDPTMGLRKPGELREKDGVAFYRFKVVQIAQVKAGGSPMFLHRGGLIVLLGEMQAVRLQSWADDLAENLMRRRWPGPEKYGLIGQFDPLRATPSPEIAGPVEQGTVALALLRYCNTPAVSNAARARSKASYQRLLADLAQVEGPETAPWADAVAASAFLEAIGGGMGYRPSGKPLNVFDAYNQCEDVLSKSFDRERGFAAEVPVAAQGLLTWALVDSSRVTDGDPSREPTCRLASRAAFRETSPAQLVSQMPWLGWSQTCWTAWLDGGLREPIPAAAGLREMRAMVWQHQLKTEDLPTEAADLAGGIMFTTSRQPLPTWQAARPLAFIATMLGDPRLTDANEIDAELAHLLASLRFLRQLTADEAECHMYKDPAGAIGGVRNSLFDQRMPPEATAMTLLTVCETLRSLDAIKARKEVTKKSLAPAPEAVPKPVPK